MSKKAKLEEKLKEWRHDLDKFWRYRKNWWFKVDILITSTPVTWVAVDKWLTLNEAIRIKERYQDEGEQARITLYEKRISHKKS